VKPAIASHLTVPTAATAPSDQVTRLRRRPQLQSRLLDGYPDSPAHSPARLNHHRCTADVREPLTQNPPRIRLATAMSSKPGRRVAKRAPHKPTGQDAKRRPSAKTAEHGKLDLHCLAVSSIRPLSHLSLGTTRADPAGLRLSIRVGPRRLEALEQRSHGSDDMERRRQLMFG
jgi:hypothetical protein